MLLRVSPRNNLAELSRCTMRDARCAMSERCYFSPDLTRHLSLCIAWQYVQEPASVTVFNRLLPVTIKGPPFLHSRIPPFLFPSPLPLSLVVSHPLPPSSPSCPFATAFYFIPHGHKSIRALIFGIRLTGHSCRSLRSGAFVSSLIVIFQTKIRASPAVYITDA